MQSFDRGIFQASYAISAFNIQVGITNSQFSQVNIPRLTINEIEVSSRFKEYSNKYLAYELINIHTQTNKAITTAFLNSNDIKLFFDHYEALSKSDNEVNMKSTFNGEGGLLNIEVKMKPIKMLKTSIAKSLVKILIYTIIVIGLTSWAYAYKLWPLLFIGSIFTGGFYISLVNEEVKQIKTFNAEIKIYGQ
jgi:hypothetical protein